MPGRCRAGSSRGAGKRTRGGGIPAWRWRVTAPASGALRGRQYPPGWVERAPRCEPSVQPRRAARPGPCRPGSSHASRYTVRASLPALTPLSVHGYLRAGGIGDKSGAEQLASGPRAGLDPGQDALGCFGGDGGRCADAFTGAQFGGESMPAGPADLGPGAGVGSAAVRCRVGDVCHHVGGAAGQPGRLEVTDRPGQHLPLRRRRRSRPWRRCRGPPGPPDRPGR